MRRAIAALALCACQAGPAPEVERPLNDEAAAPYGATEAARIALDEWAEVIDVPGDEPPPIRWYYGSLVYESGRSAALSGEGMTVWDGDYAEIHLTHRDRPSMTRLPYETLFWLTGTREHDQELMVHAIEVSDILYEHGL